MTEWAQRWAKTLAEAAAVFVKPAYEPELEKMRLAFEQQKWQQEMEQRKTEGIRAGKTRRWEQARELEQAKLDADEKQRQQKADELKQQLELEKAKFDAEMKEKERNANKKMKC